MSHSPLPPEIADAVMAIHKEVTGTFPDGKLDENDEGGVAIGVAIDQGNVVIHFPKPIAWLAFPPEQAIEIAHVLKAHADFILADKTSTTIEN
jgi:hypothetical protein